MAPSTTGTLLLIVLSFLVTACSTAPETPAVAFRLSGCGRQISREELSRALARRGFLRATNSTPYDLFRRPLTGRPESTGELAVVVCAGHSENYLVLENHQGCDEPERCLAADATSVRQIAKDWACQIDQRTGKTGSLSGKTLNNISEDTCSFITPYLML